MKKLWQKNAELDKAVEAFTVGKDRDLDVLLAKYDVLGSLAHGAMLQAVNLITEKEWSSLRDALREIYRQIEQNDFTIDEGVEDIHSQIELLLTERAGEAGKKIHTGRSRNDQVLLDIKLFTRARLADIVTQASGLFEVLIQLSDKHKDALLPGYTHLQVAMPSSFGLWFGAYAESLIDDLRQLQTAYTIVNKNPLGSAAGYGSSFPIDRQMTTELLGFDDLDYNVVYAQMGRGRVERIVSQALSSLAETLGRLAMDITLYLSQNFAFISFPDSVTTGSSIMPHKKNPDVFEIVRARCNRLKALPNEIMLIQANLPSGYHRDLQLIKERFLPALFDAQECLNILTHVLPHIQIRENILEEEKYTYLFTVDAVNKLIKQGIPFREAYRQVGKRVESGAFVKPNALVHTHIGSKDNLPNRRLAEIWRQVRDGFPFKKVAEAEAKLLSG
ncbi:MAG TPA: argininosuccinate lyase [Caldithrix abyssi]|uniref:Argininosuccinate lyase n=1 Tax=Caldithrix abyssi TaxID=187145 RepID=A0A7V4WUA0_CALAY|nr:argininosuccinate lyase [Caldithrix abyssi]